MLEIWLFVVFGMQAEEERFTLKTKKKNNGTAIFFSFAVKIPFIVVAYQLEVGTELKMKIFFDFFFFIFTFVAAVVVVA